MKNSFLLVQQNEEKIKKVICIRLDPVSFSFRNFQAKIHFF